MHLFVEDLTTGSLSNGLPRPPFFHRLQCHCDPGVSIHVVPVHHLSDRSLLTKFIFSPYFRDSLGFHLEGNIIFSLLDLELICYRKGWAVEHVVTACCVARGTPGNSNLTQVGSASRKTHVKARSFVPSSAGVDGSTIPGHSNAVYSRTMTGSRLLAVAPFNYVLSFPIFQEPACSSSQIPWPKQNRRRTNAVGERFDGSTFTRSPNKWRY